MSILYAIKSLPLQFVIYRLTSFRVCLNVRKFKFPMISDLSMLSFLVFSFYADCVNILCFLLLLFSLFCFNTFGIYFDLLFVIGNLTIFFQIQLISCPNRIFKMPDLHLLNFYEVKDMFLEFLSMSLSVCLFLYQCQKVQCKIMKMFNIIILNIWYYKSPNSFFLLNFLLAVLVDFCLQITSRNILPS